jgi:hypothetical protein
MITAIAAQGSEIGQVMISGLLGQTELRALMTSAIAQNESMAQQDHRRYCRRAIIAKSSDFGKP